jgi:hypothetical protein
MQFDSSFFFVVRFVNNLRYEPVNFINIKKGDYKGLQHFFFVAEYTDILVIFCDVWKSKVERKNQLFFLDNISIV